MRVLVVGAEGIKDIAKGLAWNELFVQNKSITVGDYDIAIFNLNTLDSELIRRPNYSQTIKSLQSSIFQASKSNTRVVFVTAPVTSGLINRNINNYSFIPLRLDIANEENEVFSSKPNDDYFNKVNKSTVNFKNELHNQSPYSSLETLKLTDVCVTRHKQLVSFVVKVYENKKVDANGVITLNADPDGSLEFYPPQNSTDPDSSLKNLIRYLAPSDGNYMTMLPEQIKLLRLPGEEDLVKDINKLQISIDSLIKDKQSKTEEIRELDKFKGILAFKGKSLVNAVVAVMSKMKIDLVGKDVYEEDKTFVSGKARIPVEIKGHNKGANEADLRQAISRTKKAILDDGVTNQAILIINHDVLKLDITDRLPEFAPDIVKKAVPWNVCLLSTVTLFKYLDDYLKHGETFLKQELMNVPGVVKFRPYVSSEPDSTNQVE